MKRLRAALAILAIAGTSLAPVSRAGALDDPPLSEETFENPATPPIAEWLWNGDVWTRDLDYGTLDRQLRSFRDAGFREITILPWDGLSGQSGVTVHEPGEMSTYVEYLSEEFFDRIRYAVERAKEYGLGIWIEDTNTAPGGMADNRTTDGHPEYGYAQMFEIRRGDAYQIVRRPFGIDVLNPAAVRRYLDVLYEEYYRHVGDHFGTTIRGFWTDEVSTHASGDMFPTSLQIPWSPALPAFFRARNGYDIDTPENLERVFHPDAGPDARAVAITFWETIAERFARAYFDQVQAWCSAHGVQLIAQPLGEETLANHERQNGDFFRILRGVDVPGVDLVLGNIDRGMADTGVANGGITMKLLSSVAHVDGKRWAQMEPFGLTGWDLNLRDLKWGADLSAVRGANLFAPAAYFYGVGQSDAYWAPDLFERNVNWRYHRRWVEYVARLQDVLSGGMHVAPIAVLYPIASSWANADAGIDDTITNLSAYLSSIRRDHDIVPEEILAESGTTIESGAIKRAGEEYSILLLPAARVAAASTLAAAERLVRSGGSVVAIGALPSLGRDGQDAEIAARVQALFGIRPDERPAGVVRNRSEGGGTAVFVPTSFAVPRAQAAASAGSFAVLRDVLDELLPRDADVGPHPLLPNGLSGVEVLHRQRGGEDVYFIVNSPGWVANGSANPVRRNLAFVGTAIETTLSVPARGIPEWWDPETGRIERALEYRIQNGRLMLPLRLPANGSALLVLRRGDPHAVPHVVATNLDEVSRIGEGEVVGLSTRSGEFFADVEENETSRRVTGVLSNAPTTVSVDGVWDVRIGLPETRAYGAAPVVPADERRTLGDWTRPDPVTAAPGHPGYAGGARYGMTVEFPDADQVRIDLGSVNEIADVSLDGRAVGSRAWQPYAAEIAVAGGLHRLEVVVVNSSANEAPGPGIGSDPARPSGLFGPVRIIGMSRVVLA